MDRVSVAIICRVKIIELDCCSHDFISNFLNLIELLTVVC